MLDDRGDSQSMNAITDLRVVNGPEMRHAWDTYLGAQRDPAPISPYAALPAPPTSTGCRPPCWYARGISRLLGLFDDFAEFRSGMEADERLGLQLSDPELMTACEPVPGGQDDDESLGAAEL